MPELAFFIVRYYVEKEPENPMTEKTIQQAREEIRTVLRRYRVSWNDVAPDQDAELWRTVRPVAKKIRKALFRKAYPSLR